MLKEITKLLRLKEKNEMTRRRERENSELYYSRTEILGSSLFLQSVLAKLLRQHKRQTNRLSTVQPSRDGLVRREEKVQKGNNSDRAGFYSI